MKRTLAILLFCLLFATAFGRRKPAVPAPQPVAAEPALSPADTVADSLRSLYGYTEGLKRAAIDGDTLAAIRLLEAAVKNDPDYAPARHALATLELYSDPERALDHARRAYLSDTTDKWYLQAYAQLLVMTDRYDEALPVYERLLRVDPKNPNNYRLLALLYGNAQRYYSAIAMLDSAEVRFGRIEPLGEHKRRLLVATRQYDRAIEEAKAQVEATPYEIEPHIELGELYGEMGRDSLALAEFAAARAIDSTDVVLLKSMSDFYNDRHDYRNLLAVSKSLFMSDGMTVEEKLTQFGNFTSDLRFYQDNFFQINDIALTLAIKYPHDPRVVECYATHLITSGQLDQALEFYKLHLADEPPVKHYYRMVVDIESYKQRPDSVERYVTEALRLFPEEVEFRMARGGAQLWARQYDRAVKSYEEALRYAPTDSLRGAIWGMIGDIRHQQAKADSTRRNGYGKAMKRCYAAYEKALGLHRDNAMVLNNYAYFLSCEEPVSERDLEKALTMSSRAIALSENNPTYLDTYAWVLYRLGRLDEAKKTMQQAISLDRQHNPELYLHYGDILSAKGERFLAETYWRKALENGYEAPEEILRRIEAQKQQQNR